MSVNLIGKHEKDPRALRDAMALTLEELMAEVMRGELPDSKTQIAVLKAARILGLKQ